MMPPKTVRMTIRRTVTMEYDVFTEQYDDSYTDAQIIQREREFSLTSWIRQTDFDVLTDEMIRIKGSDAPA